MDAALNRVEPYAPLAMFKLMLLGQWHGLSDTQLEHALKVRLDFMVVTGFEHRLIRQTRSAVIGLFVERDHHARTA